MSIRRKTAIFLSITILLLSLPLFLSSQDSVNLSTLKSIIIIDNKNPNIDNEKVLKSIEENEGIVNNFLEHIGKSKLLNLKTKVIKASDISLSKINETLNKLDIHGDDVLLFYYTGYRKYKDNQINFILSDKEKMENRSLERLLLAYGARMTLLITDSVSETNFKADVYDDNEEQISKYRVKNNDTAHRNLLYDYKGIMHLSACEKEQASLMTKTGGIFTKTLFNDILLREPESTWKENIEKLKDKTSKKFSEWKEKLSEENKKTLNSFYSDLQTPITHSLPQKIISDLAIIKFSDRIFEKAIRNVVGIKKNYVRYRDIKYMEGLYLSGYNIRNISAIEHFVQLNEIDFSRNQITELEPLEHLYQLKRLNLRENRIENISHLQNLIGIEYLSLGNNLIDNVTYLKGLTNLIELNLLDNRISDVSPLKDLYKLETLHLHSNRIESADDLKYLKELRSLSIGNNSLSEISFLSALTKLRELGINQNQISDLSPLADMSNLFLLSITQNKVEDISPLKGLKSIQRLYASNNNISDISALSELKTLTKLGLSQNKIKDITPLKALDKIKVLSLGGNEIEDISVIAEMTSLQDISLGGNKIKDITPLMKLYNNGGFKKKDVYYFVNIEDNDLDLKHETEARKIVDTLLRNGVDVRWEIGNKIR